MYKYTRIYSMFSAMFLEYIYPTNDMFGLQLANSSVV